MMWKADEMMEKLIQEQCEQIAKPGDKLYVIKEEALFGWDDDYYDISFPTDVLAKTVKEVNVSSSGYYTIWFTDNTTRKPKDTYKTCNEAYDVMIEQRKESWKNNDCDVLLEKLLKIKNQIDSCENK